MSVLLVVVVMLLLALVGSRLFVVVGAATALCFLLFVADGDAAIQLGRIVTKMESLTTKNVFLSIPFFIAAGTIMTKGGIARRLTDLARALVGWVPGGLAVASIIACIVFAAISGSSPVTLVAVGSVMFPTLIDAGYPKRFSIGLLASAGSLGSMIPPAIAMLIYSISVQGSAAVEPSDLFFAGFAPAMFIASCLAIYSVVVGVGVARDNPASREPFDAARLISCFIHGDVPLKAVPGLLAEAATLIGSLILIVVLAFGLNDFLAEMDTPGLIRRWVETAGLSSWQFMLVVNLILIVLGALMDSISATLVFAPILAPVAIHTYGIDPIHFGVVFVVNMEIGYIAPPVATNLFVAAALFRVQFMEVAKAILPTLGIICAALVLIIYVPTLSKGPLNLREGLAFYEPFPWDGKPAEIAPAPVPATAEPGEPAKRKPETIEEMMKRRAAEKAAAEAAGQAPPAP